MDEKQFENYMNQQLFTVERRIREDTDDFILEYLENSKVVQEARLSKDDLRRALWLLAEERAGHLAHYPETLTDAEKRIFLSAMRKEYRLCETVDKNNPNGRAKGVVLTEVCDSIKRKVKACLWGEEG